MTTGWFGCTSPFVGIGGYGDRAPESALVPGFRRGRRQLEERAQRHSFGSQRMSASRAWSHLAARPRGGRGRPAPGRVGGRARRRRSSAFHACRAFLPGQDR